MLTAVRTWPRGEEPAIALRTRAPIIATPLRFRIRSASSWRSACLAVQLGRTQPPGPDAPRCLVDPGTTSVAAIVDRHIQASCHQSRTAAAPSHTPCCGASDRSVARPLEQGVTAQPQPGTGRKIADSLGALYVWVHCAAHATHQSTAQPPIGTLRVQRHPIAKLAHLGLTIPCYRSVRQPQLSPHQPNPAGTPAPTPPPTPDPTNDAPTPASSTQHAACHQTTPMSS